MQDLTPKRIGGRRGEPLNAEQIAAFDNFLEERRRDERERPARERAKREVARTKALTELAALPIEERLARIEAWIYDYQPQYVPPPMFK